MYVPMYFVILPFLHKCQDFLTRGGAIFLKGTSVQAAKIKPYLHNYAYAELKRLLKISMHAELGLSN